MSDYKAIKERHNQSNTEVENICNRDLFSVKLQSFKTEYKDLLEVAQAELGLGPFQISMMEYFCERI